MGRCTLMKKLTLPKMKGKIIPFPERGFSQRLKKQPKQHQTQISVYDENVVSQFIRALVQNNLVLVMQMVTEHGDDLATVQGNYFCPPLLIACKHNHMEMVNYLLEKGACAKGAINDPRFKYIRNKTRNYLKSVSQFGLAIWEKLGQKTPG